MKIVEQLEREGGHILVLTFLTCLFLPLLLNFPDNTAIKDGFDMLLGALLLAMKSGAQKPSSESSIVTTTSTTVNPPTPPSDAPAVKQ